MTITPIEIGNFVMHSALNGHPPLTIASTRDLKVMALTLECALQQINAELMTRNTKPRLKVVK